jgi:hypothetical protein
MANTTVQRQAPDTRRRHDTTRHRQSKKLRLAVTVAPGNLSLRPHRPRQWIDVNAAHQRQVDH